MSTRSGKRIHASDQENIDKVEPDVVLKSERKTRSRKVKETDNLDVTVTKHKRNNYVAYPTDDEGIKEASDEPSEVKPHRKLRRNTLKEHNVEVSEDKRRQTRKSKKNAEIPENIEPDSVVKAELPNGKLKTKKNKKKKSKDHEQANHIDQVNTVKYPVEDNAEIPNVNKKSKKKKKGKRNQSNEKQHNKSNTSVDSFHSAAGSPINVYHENVIAKESTPLQNGNISIDKDTKLEISSDVDKRKKIGRKGSILNDATNTSIELNTTFDKDESEFKLNNSVLKIHNKRKSSILNAAENESLHILNTTFEKESKQIDTTFEKDAQSQNKRNKSFVNFLEKNTNNTSIKHNTTFEKEEFCKEKRGKKSSIANASYVKLNSTFDKLNNDSKILNNTFEKTESRITRSTFEKPKETLNTTFEKITTDETASLNSTYDNKSKKTTLDTTFDKIENKSNSGKSSLLTSDSSANATIDKSNMSRISITSDDSRTENIINTTPVLIESSMDESMEIKTDSTKKTNELIVPQLVREGTFTKEGPEVASPKPKLKVSIERTPTKRMSLPSPGCTPFPNKSGKKAEKSILNVTRSIERGRRSSLVEPRQTRVMFCSPVNNPALGTQQKRIIKSSMKGSNKSFVFEESGSTNRPVARKRSFTLNDADETRAKRKRLADDLQQSVDRLSRPRTSSAAAKLDSITPRKILTPKSKDADRRGRTKLPNFAALHRREFAKMESLTDCQLRKAKRARQLLTPNGGVNVLERTSTGSESSQKEPAKDQSKTTKELPKKPQELKPFTPKLPTLESLRPGYTRFGFKMNCNINPFSFGTNTEIKPKENRPNGPKIVKPVKPCPSLSGATSRKEMAKQTVMREKSFTSLSSKRETKRTENRTVIKGVRTNRRFELQMKMRNID